MLHTIMDLLFRASWKVYLFVDFMHPDNEKRRENKNYKRAFDVGKTRYYEDKWRFGL